MAFTLELCWARVKSLEVKPTDCLFTVAKQTGVHQASLVVSFCLGCCMDSNLRNSSLVLHASHQVMAL